MPVPKTAPAPAAWRRCTRRVNGLNGHPLTAHYTQWLRFLRKNKAAELREFISQNFPVKCVEGGVCHA
jgi:hypothetical protein